MTEDYDHEANCVIGFDILPTEIYHQVGAFLFDNSFSSEPAQSSLSAVYFYFYLLSLLNSHMYYRVHSSEFWQYDKIQIVLRNKQMFNRSILMQQQEPLQEQQDLTTSDKTSADQSTYTVEEEETMEELQEETHESSDGYHSLSQVQFNYLYELIKVCQFRYIQFVGMQSLDYSVFIHDMLKKLSVNEPEILHNLQSLSIHCTMVDLECLRTVFQSCEQLKEFRLFFFVHQHLSNKYITSNEQLQILERTEHDNDMMTEYPCLETIEYHRARVTQHHQSPVCLEFIVGLCKIASNLRSLSIQSIPAKIELFAALGQHCKQLENFILIAPSHSSHEDLDNGNILEMIRGCPKLATLVLDHYMIKITGQLVPRIIDILRDSLKCLKVTTKRGETISAVSISDNSVPCPLVIEEMRYTHDSHYYYYYNETPLVRFGYLCGNRCVRSFSAEEYNIEVRDYELHLFSKMQKLAFKQLSGLSIKQVLGACTTLQQLTIHSEITPTDASDILTTCHGLIELSIKCSTSTLIPTILQLQPENLKKLAIQGSMHQGVNTYEIGPADRKFYGHFNLEDFTYQGAIAGIYVEWMLEHCPNLHTLKCEFTTLPSDSIFHHCPKLRSVTLLYAPVIFPYRMNQLRFFFLTISRYSYQNRSSVELHAVEFMNILIHCPSVVSLRVADFENRIETLVDCFASDIEKSCGEEAPVGAACRFIIEKLCKSAYEKSGMTTVEKEEVQESIEHCLARYCDDNCTDDVLFNTSISDSGIELHLRRLIALLRHHYEKLQEEKDQFGFLMDQ